MMEESPPESQIPPSAARAIGGAGLVFAAAILVWQIRQNPDFSFTDEYGYLLVAREAWRQPATIFNGWGRTFNTLAMMPAALFSVSASRLWIGVLGLVSILLGWSYARRARLRYACFVPWLAAFLPQFIETGWGAIPQIPAGLVLMAALWLAQSGRWKAAALTAGLLPLVRYRAISLAAGFAAVCLYRRRRSAALLTALPLIVVNAAGFLITHKLPMLFLFGPQSAAIEYLNPPSEFFSPLLRSSGAAMLFLIALGLLESPRRKDLMMLSGMCGLYVLVHVTAAGSGLYPLSSRFLFLTPLIPGGAVLAAAGLESAVARFLDAVAAGVASDRTGPSPLPARRAQERYAIAGLLLAIAAGALMSDRLAPRELNPASIDLDRAVEYLQTHFPADRSIVSASARIYYKMPRPLPDPTVRPGFNAIPLGAMQPGTLAVWDLRFGDAFGLPFRELHQTGGYWKQIWKAPTAAIYEKQSQPLADDAATTSTASAVPALDE